MSTATATASASLTAADHCDRCGARAQIRVVLPSGTDLVFCGHHARAYDNKLREAGVEFVHAGVGEGSPTD
ncbi:MAG: DUF7455 domain-containing protein [Mycobacteriales bacterium]